MGLGGLLGGAVIGTIGVLALPEVGAVLGLVVVGLMFALRAGTRRAPVLVD
jgi:MFS transporter, DHA1 family, purine base/nucleoside efflux pump